MKKGILAGIILLLCSLNSATAQSSLGIDTAAASYIYKDTTCYGNLDGYQVSVVNYGPQPYTGEVVVEYWLDTSNTCTPMVQIGIDSFSVVNLGNMIPITDSGVTVPITAAFKHGINTVVIWPRLSNVSAPFTTHDSLCIPVYVDCFFGIEEHRLVTHPDMFPNPAKQLVYVANMGQNFVIERVRICSPEGKLVTDHKFTGWLDVTNLTPGLYLVEFCSSDGRVSRGKLLKE